MTGSLEQEQTQFIAQFEVWLKSYIASCQAHQYRADILVESQAYSLLSGGKRFRPFLAYSVFKMFSEKTEKIQNVSLALEMIHTYSLIHDDLPCMDNDDFRRGKPTNHKVFSEEIALLAADGLLSDVFNLLARDTFSNAEVKIKLIEYISEKIGSFGMVSGQTKDMQANNQITLNEIKLIHQLKTANLIQAAAVCGALVAEVNESELHNISDFSYALGMAFQIKDDILDHGEKEQDFKSYAALLGLDKTQIELQNYSDAALVSLKKLNVKTEILQQLVEFNLKRNH